MPVVKNVTVQKDSAGKFVVLSHSFTSRGEHLSTEEVGTFSDRSAAIAARDDASKGGEGGGGGGGGGGGAEREKESHSIQTGPRGGQFHMSASGEKVYGSGDSGGPGNAGGMDFGAAMISLSAQALPPNPSQWPVVQSGIVFHPLSEKRGG